MTRLFKLRFGFLLGLLVQREDSIPDFNRKHISFHSLELISTTFSHSTVARFFITFDVFVILLWYLYLLYQLFYYSTFLLYLSCWFLCQLNLSTKASLFLCYYVFFFQHELIIILPYICANTYKYIYAYMYVYVFANMLTHVN